MPDPCRFLSVVDGTSARQKHCAAGDLLRPPASQPQARITALPSRDQGFETSVLDCVLLFSEGQNGQIQDLVNGPDVVLPAQLGQGIWADAHRMLTAGAGTRCLRAPARISDPVPGEVFAGFRGWIIRSELSIALSGLHHNPVDSIGVRPGLPERLRCRRLRL